MGFYTDEWTLQYENTREGELYREKKRLQQDLEDTRRHRLAEDIERERTHYLEEEQRRQERENILEERMNLHDMIRHRDEDIEHLELRTKFGIQEVEP